MKGRVQLAEFLASEGFVLGAEVGVFGGYFSEVLLKTIPDLKLLCVDIWGWGKYKVAEEECIKRLEPYNATIIKKPSVEAAKDVPDGSLDFVYIDAAHDHKNVMLDLEAWVPKVRDGGIVCGDDFYKFPNSGNTGVMTAVTEYCSDNYYNLNISEWDLQNPVRDDRQPQFWFRKENNGPRDK